MTEISNFPMFSLAVAETDDIDAFGETLCSLYAQVYPNWRLLVSSKQINGPWGSLLQATAFRNCNRAVHISDDSVALDYAGNFHIRLLSGDLLARDALAEFAVLSDRKNAPDLLYSDDISSFGSSERGLFFKPKLSPELLLSTDYIGRSAIRRNLFPEHFFSRFDFDEVDLWSHHLSLVCGNQAPIGTKNSYRVPRALFELRKTTNDRYERQIKRAAAMLQLHIERLGISVTLNVPGWARNRSLSVFDYRFPDDGPSVSIIIPSKNNWTVLDACLTSIKRLTSYKNYKILIVDNGSDDPKTKEYLDTCRVDSVVIPSPPNGFSFSYINNQAVNHCESELLLFLNDDTEIVSGNWLSDLVGWSKMSGVGSVGGRLIFPNGQLQHAGIVNHILDGILPAPAFKLLKEDEVGYRGLDRTARDCSAVTGACLLTPRKIFKEVGGFNDTEFSVAYQDCEYGFALTQRGYRQVYVPTAQLLHFEGATRGRGRGNDKISEEVAFIEKYRSWDDPYYNPNLSVENTLFEVRPRTQVSAAKSSSIISVVLFSHNLNLEGAPLVLLDIAKGLVRSGRCHVTFVSPFDGPLHHIASEHGIRVEVTPGVQCYGIEGTDHLSAALGPLKNYLTDKNVDVVITNTVIGHWAAVAAYQIGKPYIWIIHESEPVFAHLDNWGAAHKGLARDAFRFSYMNVFVSHNTLELYRGEAPAKNLMTVYNGFDAQSNAEKLSAVAREKIRAELNVSKSDILFITPGTVCERKAQIDIIEAVKLLEREVIDRCRFVIVGDRPGDYSAELWRRKDSLPEIDRERVSIVQETPRIWDYYSAADGMVFASHLESFPRVIQEAMFCAFPIITTPVFGISELLVDKKSALFFEVGQVAQLADRISALVRDEKLREELGAAAKLSLRKFPDIADMQNEYIKLVEEAYLAGAPTKEIITVSYEHRKIQWN